MTDANQTASSRAVASPELLINRRDLRSFEVRGSNRPQIDAGQVALAIERFGLTSNNLTYALGGKAMGYWNYFPAEDGWGLMPVWATVELITPDGLASRAMGPNLLDGNTVPASLAEGFRQGMNSIGARSAA